MRFRDEWTYGDLEAFVEAADSEHLNFDFKAMGALDQTQGKKKEAAKDASAFANAAGGIIVYGVAEQSEGTYSIQQGYEATGKIRKEWLQAVLDQNIAPPITGLEVFSVEMPDSGERFALLVQIPRAEIEPHQAPKGSYYIRRGDHVGPMSHDEVKDAFFRARYPNLEATVSLRSVGNTPYHGGQVGASIKYLFTLRNVGRVAALEFLVRLQWPKGVQARFGGRGARYFDIVEDTSGCWYCIRSAGPCYTGQDPPRPVRPLRCFPGESIEFTLEVSSRPMSPLPWDRWCSNASEGTFKWEIFADSAPKKSGEAPVARIFPPRMSADPDFRARAETWDRSPPWPEELVLR